MIDQERLQLIIETALKHKADISPFDAASGDTWEAKDNGLALYNREGELYLFIPVSTVLYGNNLSLLKAACGDSTNPLKCSFLQGDSGWFVNSQAPNWQFVAQQSVLLPDSERLKFICEHLRHD